NQNCGKDSRQGLGAAPRRKRSNSRSGVFALERTTMQQQLEKRLDELRKEFEAGQNKLQELARQEQLLRETLLRISGAIQVIQEELAKNGSGTTHDGTPQ